MILEPNSVNNRQWINMFDRDQISYKFRVKKLICCKASCGGRKCIFLDMSKLTFVFAKM